MTHITMLLEIPYSNGLTQRIFNFFYIYGFFEVPVVDAYCILMGRSLGRLDNSLACLDSLTLGFYIT